MKTITSYFRNNFRRCLVCCATSATLIAILSIVAACSSDDDDKDMTPPTISGQGITASPVNCQVYHPGDTIFFRYLFEDNNELGNFNIEVHGNFDHHSHSTETNGHDNDAGECADDHDDKHEHEESGTAWVFNQSYAIPDGQKSYSAKVDIAVPKDIRHGDYHFMIRLTDKAGWQQLKAIAIKIDE